MPELITLDEAKGHVRLTHDDEDADLNDKLEAAQAIILRAMRRRDTAWNAEIEAWTAATVPRPVRQAIIVQFGELTAKRGDEDPTPVAPTPTSLSATVKAILGDYLDLGYA